MSTAEKLLIEVRAKIAVLDSRRADLVALEGKLVQFLEIADEIDRLPAPVESCPPPPDNLSAPETAKNPDAVAIGQKGGIARAEALAPDERREIASNAAKARRHRPSGMTNRLAAFLAGKPPMTVKQIVQESGFDRFNVVASLRRGPELFEREPASDSRFNKSGKGRPPMLWRLRGSPERQPAMPAADNDNDSDSDEKAEPPRGTVINDIDTSQYDRLVMHFALKFGARQPVKDSWQYAEGWIGLIRAARRYSPDRGAKFTTLASITIRHAILSVMKRAGCHNRRIGETSIPFSQTAAGELDFRGEDLAVDDWPEPDVDVQEREAEAMRLDLCDDLFRFLDERTRRFIKASVVRGLTYDEIGMREQPRISRERVRQIIEKGLEKMRDIAAANPCDTRLRALELTA